MHEASSPASNLCPDIPQPPPVRRGIEVQISNSHSDYFVKGKQAIRADMRVALVIYRASAFSEVTGV
ncbi:MAG: hypothetical protein WD120_03565 [Gemmatimonadota bacterium]